MPPKSKKQKTDASQTNHSCAPVGEFASALQGASENPSNSQRAILLLPIELREEILDYFPKITFFTETPHDDPVLPAKYKVRTTVLRALSQVCVAYRWAFFESLWETVNVCFLTGESKVFYRDVGGALERHCDGITATPAIRPCIRTANIVLTRYKTAIILPKFREMLPSLQNLHTPHLLHTHTQMSKHLKEAFRDQLVLPNIRTLVIQGYCHDVLRCCPNVLAVWCIRDDGMKLVPIIKKYCPKVQEMRGFGGEEKMITKIVNAAPNLREFEVSNLHYEPLLEHLHSFNKFNTVIIRTSKEDNSDPGLQKCIHAFKQKFRGLPKTQEKRRIRLLHALVMKPSSNWPYRRLDSDRCFGKYTEIDLD